MPIIYFLIFVFFAFFVFKLKLVDRVFDRFSVIDLLIFNGFIVPLAVFLALFYFGYAIDDSCVAASTLSLALNAMVTLLFTVKKETKDEISKENIK